MTPFERSLERVRTAQEAESRKRVDRIRDQIRNRPATKQKILVWGVLFLAAYGVAQIIK